MKDEANGRNPFYDGQFDDEPDEWYKMRREILDALEAWESSNELALANARIAELEAERDEAYEYLAGILSIDPDMPDCADNHGETYQSQGLANWGAAQLTKFRAALGEP